MGRSKYNRQQGGDGTNRARVLLRGVGGWKGQELVDDGHAITPEEWDFMCAMERYKKERKIRFVRYTDVLSVIKQLGYVRLTPPDPAVKL